MSNPAEILLFEFLQESIDASGADDVIYAIELHDTIYQKITKDRGLRISDAVSDMAPGPGGDMREFNARIVLVCFAKVGGKDKKDRQPALTDVFQLQQAVYQLLYNDPSLGGRVCDTNLERGSRGYDILDGSPYAVANIPVVVNPIGSQ